VFDEPAKTTTGDRNQKSQLNLLWKSLRSGVAVSEPVAPAPFDATKFAKELVVFSPPSLERLGEQEKPPLTPEEAKKLLNVLDPTPEWLTKFDQSRNPTNAAIAEMRDGMVKHSDTITQHRLKELQTMLEEKFSPALERIVQMDNEQRGNEVWYFLPSVGRSPHSNRSSKPLHNLSSTKAKNLTMKRQCSQRSRQEPKL